MGGRNLVVNKKMVFATLDILFLLLEILDIIWALMGLPNDMDKTVENCGW
jgi:hypothetical protein